MDMTTISINLRHIKLRRCPFCDFPATIESTHNSDHIYSYSFGCHNPNCYIQPKVQIDLSATDSTYNKDALVLIDQWNSLIDPESLDTPATCSMIYNDGYYRKVIECFDSWYGSLVKLNGRYYIEV